jgi:hypothetical protein
MIMESTFTLRQRDVNTKGQKLMISVTRATRTGFLSLSLTKKSKILRMTLRKEGKMIRTPASTIRTNKKL